MAIPLAPDAPVRRVLVVGGPGAGKSILRFAWQYRSRHRHHIEDGLARFGAHLRVHMLCDDRAVEAFLAAAGTS